MPTNSTRNCGPMTSRMPLFFEARSSALLGRRAEPLGGRNNVAAGLFIRLELDEVSFFRILEKVGERLVAVVGLVEARIAALERLLHHRAPDLFLRAAFGEQRLERAEHEVDRLLALVLARRRRFAPLLGGAALLLLLAHQVV